MSPVESTAPDGATQLLASLRALGAEVWADDGQLRYRAARGVLTDQHLARLRHAKAEVLALLDAERHQPIVPDPHARFDDFPLTDVQSAYLLGRGHAFGLGGVACHGYLEVTYPRLDSDALEHAWNRLVERHDMLRAVIEPDGYQHVLAKVPAYRIQRADLRAAAPDARERHLRDTRAAMDHRIYPTQAWPLFELRLTRTDAGDIVHISLDSLIADWASAGVLFRELDMLRAGADKDLPPLEITFRDYLLAQRKMAETPRYQDDRRYWMARIGTLPAAPELPASLAGADDAPARFTRLPWRMPMNRWTRFCTLAGSHGLTPSVAVLAAYADVLRRWSRRAHFTVNLTLLNRQDLHPQVNLLVGDFTAVTLLEVAPATGSHFADRAAALGTQLFADLDHRLYSGIEVIREIARRRGREAAAMPVVYTSAIGLGPRETPASGRRHGHGVTQTPQVYLDCQVMDDADGLAVNWDVRQGIFPPGVAEDMHASLCHRLEALSQSEAAWRCDLPLPLPAAQQDARNQANATAAPLASTLLHHDVIAHAHRQPDALAVADHRVSLRYASLARRASAVAAALRAAGCEAGQIVPILMEKGVEQVVAVLGVMLAGAAYMPIDPSQPHLRRERMRSGATAPCVLAQSWCPAIAELPEDTRVIAVDTLQEADALPPLPRGNPDALAYVIYTSGSTGEPKGVMISHRAALNTIQDINRRGALTADDRALGLARLSFDLSVYDIFGPLGAGAALILPDPGRGADPSHWAALIAEHRVTIWNSVPAQLQMLTTYLDTEPVALPSLRLALLSGDWVPVTLPGHARRHMPDLQLIALGGATEAAIWSNCHRIQQVPPDWTSIPYGRPLTNQGLRVLDASHADVPDWVAGDLYITGHGLALGYLGDPALTEARFVEHPRDGQRMYRTGDLARYRPDGEVEFLGREDGQVKVHGHRIELGEIEAALLAHPAVGAAAVVATGEHHSERTLLAFVVPATPETDTGPTANEGNAQSKRPPTSLHASALGAFLAQRLPAAMLPSHVQIVDQFPLTPNGKVDRAELARWKPAAMEDGAKPGARDVPQDGLQARLCALWAEALQIEHIGPDENFYDHGADSLILARMAGRLRESVPQAQAHTYDALLRQMLNQPSVAALARALRAAPSDAAPPASTPPGDAARTASDTLGGRPGSNALLVPFGEDAGGDESRDGGAGPMRVMFHAALGTLDYFQHLGNALARQNLGPVVGVAVADPRAYVSIPPASLVFAVADDYAARLAATGRQRFQLVGYCLGGLIATEVARRLLDRGLDVLDLTLVDSIPMFVDIEEELAFEAIFAPNLHLDPVAAVFGPEVDSKDLHRAIDLLMARHGNRVPAGALALLDGDPGLRAVAAAAGRRGMIAQSERLAGYAQAAAAQRGLPIDPAMVPAFFNICRHSMRAAHVDLPAYVGDMTYLRCEEQQSFGITAGVGHLAAQYWRDCCLGQFALIDVPGNHFSVVEPPLADTVAEHIAQALRRARREIR